MAATFGALSVAGTLSLVMLISLGEVTVVSTAGVSMQPLLHEGDLAVVRTSDYEVGDVVAYPDRSGQTVLHRITERSGDVLTLQGDNNDWIDPERPRTTDVIGELWFHVPSGGKALDWLRDPLPASALLAALGMMITRSSPDTTDRRWRPGRTAARVAVRPDRSADRPPGSRATSGLRARTVLGGAAFVLVVAVGIGAMAYSRPTSRLSEVRSTFAHHGELTYHAAVPPGPVYEDGEITTGDPVFVGLTDELQLRFAYRFESDDLREVGGDVSLAVELTAGNGWSRTVALGEPTRFTGTDAVVEAPLELSELRELIADVERATGVRASTYAVTVAPTVTVTATADGEPVTETFAERHEFQLDDKQLRPAGKAADADRTADAQPAMLTERSGAATTTTRTPSTVSAFGRSVEVATVRTATTTTAVAALLVALAAGAYLTARGPRTEADRIAARYGRRIVDVDGGEGGEARTIIDVSTMTALVRLADHHDRLILHHRSDAGDTFMVDAHDTLYRHRVGPAPVEAGRSPADRG